MKKSQFWTLFILIYFGIGLMFVQSFEQGAMNASHGQNNFTTDIRISFCVFWPINGILYLFNGYPNTYSAR